MIKYLLSLLFIVSCGMQDDPGGVYKKSKYINNLNYQLDSAQAYFETTYNFQFKRPFKEFVSFYFYEDMEDVKALCKQTDPVAGCIRGYWLFIIYDTPDANIRCQAVLHEVGHMALAQISNDKDWDYGHSNPYFNTFVFDEKNCGY